MHANIDSAMFRAQYATVSDGDANWQALKFPGGDTYGWEPDSTYIRKAPYFDGMRATPKPVEDIVNARCLAWLGDSVTTDHISPAGSIKAKGPAGTYLTEHGVPVWEFNSYGSRRGNHEAMVRGTFANVRLRNKLAPGTEGGVTRLLPQGEGMSIYDASVQYIERGVPLCILAGKEYGSGSSRDWAAKGPNLLGIKFVIAESYERIHRSNLVGMGILPLQFQQGDNVETYALTGEEVFTLGEPGQLRAMLESGFASGKNITVTTTGGERPGGGVPGDNPHRYAAGDPVLPARRDPAVRAAAVGGQGIRQTGLDRSSGVGPFLLLSHRLRRRALFGRPCLRRRWYPTEACPCNVARVDRMRQRGMVRCCSDGTRVFVCVSAYLGRWFCCLPFLPSAAQQQRVPATPLITHNPYFSVWSDTDDLTASDTVHLDGQAAADYGPGAGGWADVAVYGARSARDACHAADRAQQHPDAYALQLHGRRHCAGSDLLHPDNPVGSGGAVAPGDLCELCRRSLPDGRGACGVSAAGCEPVDCGE